VSTIAPLLTVGRGGNHLVIFHIVGEPFLDGVPLLSAILAATILVVIWSGFAYRRYYYPYASRYYYRRGTYVRRPRRWVW